MILIRCTNKLLKLSKVKPQSEIPAIPAKPLCEWYANMISLTFPGKSGVIYTHAPSRLSVITVGRSIRTTIKQFESRLIDLLLRIDAPKHFMEIQSDALGDYVIAKTDSRSMLGSMNDITGHLQVGAYELDSFDQLDIGAFEDGFSQLPCGWKGSGQVYITPLEYLQEYCW